MSGSLICYYWITVSVTFVLFHASQRNQLVPTCIHLILKTKKIFVTCLIISKVVFPNIIICSYQPSWKFKGPPKPKKKKSIDHRKTLMWRLSIILWNRVLVTLILVKKLLENNSNSLINKYKRRLSKQDFH